MNRLVIIGNGFDIAHGLKTSYMDFINWYWDERVKSFFHNDTTVSEDCLCKLTIIGKKNSSWKGFAHDNKYFNKDNFSGNEVIDKIRKTPDMFSFECSKFFETILQSIETKGWVDIENDYYQLLKMGADSANHRYTIKELNKQLKFIQDKLVEYLNSLSSVPQKEELKEEIHFLFDPWDISTTDMNRTLGNLGFVAPNINEIHQDKKKYRQLLKPRKIMLLNFNYTSTVNQYMDYDDTINYIHGDLEHPEKIIFGYGDELDKDYQELLDRNDNELLNYAKSVKYLETRNYRDLLEFLNSGLFQVVILGHSCGNSDRTLLNTVFEHQNCVSIKPYYHKWDDRRDNYLDIVQNICRNFTDMKLFRDRVVNKEQCKTI